MSYEVVIRGKIVVAFDMVYRRMSTVVYKFVCVCVYIRASSVKDDVFLGLEGRKSDSESTTNKKEIQRSLVIKNTTEKSPETII
jgi:hypothetical protein